MRSRLLVLAAALLGTVLLVPASAATAHSIPVTERQNGMVVTVHKGASIKVLLHSTYWTIAPVKRGALSTHTDQRTQPSQPCNPPGSGCGTVTRYFTARAVGTGYLTASRTTCGEALRCTGSQGSYRVGIKVVP